MIYIAQIDNGRLVSANLVPAANDSKPYKLEDFVYAGNPNEPVSDDVKLQVIEQFAFENPTILLGTDPK